MTGSQRRSRARACLLAGAVGDALGAPVEFDAHATIRSRFGPAGLTDLVPSPYGPAGLVTDDTQMRLFTAEALLDTDPTNLDARLHAAYRRWLAAQERDGPPSGATGLAAQAWLYAVRAPGNACLSGLRAAHLGTVATPVNAGSKGCGTGRTHVLPRREPLELATTATPVRVPETARREKAEKLRAKLDRRHLPDRPCAPPTVPDRPRTGTRVTRPASSGSA